VPAHGKAIMEILDGAECLRLVSTEVIGRLAFVGTGVESWPGGEKDHFIKIAPVRITGRRVRQPL
jgi:hypothetical protein